MTQLRIDRWILGGNGADSGTVLVQGPELSIKTFLYDSSFIHSPCVSQTTVFFTKLYSSFNCNTNIYGTSIRKKKITAACDTRKDNFPGAMGPIHIMGDNFSISLTLLDN